MSKIFAVFSKKHKYLLFLSLGFLLSLTFFELLIFSLLQEILNYFNETETTNKISSLFTFLDGKGFKFLLITFFLFFTLRSFVYVGLSFVRNKLVQSVNNDVSINVFSNYLKKDFSFFVNTNSSKLISNIIIEVEKFAYHTISPLIYFLAEIFVILGIFTFLSFSYFKETLLMTFLIFIFYFLFYRTYVSKFQNLGKKKTESDSRKVDDLQKSFYIINEIKIGKLEEFFKNNFFINTKKSSKSMFTLSFFTDLPKSIIELVSLLFIFVLLYYSFFFLGYDKKEILSMSGIFVIALFRLLPSANRIYHSINSIKYHYSSIDIIYDEIFQNRIEEKKQYTKIDYGVGDIDLTNVSFSYNNQKEILSDVNIKLSKGKLIGIYGISGSGKSTLLNLICGLLDPTIGHISYNKKNILDDKDSYYDFIGYLSQNIFLIDDTIKNNIVLGNKKVDEARFAEVIESSDLKNTINGMKEKENTTLGEYGSFISGGQKQRIGLARALYKKSKILILDEPTSALDKFSENEILKTIMNLRGKVTILLVSHNKSVIEKCDEIYEIKDKKILKKV
tara:strand:+ start:6215 stop:7900 length:1686 start_codon:yes stop_codon:yes gene_type:complete